MATNKRKDAAALFELIDKSTLKVPKNAGALKIPNWWSSKSAPPAPASTTGISTDTERRSRTAASARPRPITPDSSAMARTEAHGGGSAPGPAARDVGPKVPVEAPAQHRLFDPPPAHITPPTSPSIRPPAVGVPAVAPTIKAPPPEPAPAPVAVEAAPPVETGVSSVPEAPVALPLPIQERSQEALAPKAVAPAAPRVFAPQTHAQDRNAWSPRPGAFARLPGWVLVTGVAVLAVVVVGVVVAARNLGKGTRPTATNQVAGGLQKGSGPSLPRGGSAGVAPVRRGLVYNPGEFRHLPERYYIIICSTPSQKVALDDANLLADNGISVSIETTQASAGANMLYMLVSAFDFPSATAADPAKKEIIRVGSYLKPNPFKDAHPDHGLSTPGTSPNPARGTR